MISCPTDSSTIQLYLDEALSLLARKWSNHTRMGELRIYFDELDNVNFFNLKKYYKDLASRDGNLFKVLLHSFKSKKKDIECQTLNMQINHFGQEKAYDRIYAYISLNGFRALSLPMQTWMKGTQISFILIQNGQCCKVIPNDFVDKSNIDAVEQSFLPFELKDIEKFEKTKYQYRAEHGLAGVPVYRRKCDGTLWYEDRFHTTHFEVFDSKGQKYIGEAPKDLWGEIRPVKNAKKHPII